MMSVQKNSKVIKKQKLKDKLKPILFIGPHLIFFTVFVVFPFFYGIFISFTKWDLMSPIEFAWFENYELIFTKGNVFNLDFFNGLKATLIYTVVMTPLLIIVPLIFAVLLLAVENKRIRSIFQIILYASSVLSVATVALTWRWLLDREMGVINNLLLKDINWIGTQPYAWISIFMLTLWSGIGGNMIIFMSSISGVSKSLYESASLDGANKLQQFFHITLPSIRFPMLYALVMGTIGGFNVFGQTYMFGGPESTNTVMMYIREYSFGLATPMAGMASAMSVLLGLIISVFSFIQLKLMREKD